MILVLIHFRATGDAPILTQSKFRVAGNKRFSVVISFLRSHLKMKSTDSLVGYINIYIDMYMNIS